LRKELCQTRAAGLVARKYCLQLDIIGSVQLLQYDKHWPHSTLDQKKEQALMWETFEQAQSLIEKRSMSNIVRIQKCSTLKKKIGFNLNTKSNILFLQYFSG